MVRALLTLREHNPLDMVPHCAEYGSSIGSPRTTKGDLMKMDVMKGDAQSKGTC